MKGLTLFPRSAVMESTVLQSWKEIAQYVGRGVRTVQRWEAYGLPVRRPSGRDRSAVLALKSEIDDWLRSCAKREPTALRGVEEGHQGLDGPDRDVFNLRMRDLQEKVVLAKTRSSALRQSAQDLRERSTWRNGKVA
jgi:hypothetical protein